MIVCSLPRCGATKFCLDLQESSKLDFMGELHPLHINNSAKRDAHETGFQPTFTPASFAEILINRDRYIILVNQQPYLLIDQCDHIILRKNMRNASLSFANFMFKAWPGIKFAVVLHQLRLMHCDHQAVMAYLDMCPREIVWYEDYYGDLETKTPLLDNHIGRTAITNEIDSYYG